MVCPHCQRELMEGTILCPECGVSLVDQTAAMPLEERDLSATANLPDGESDSNPDSKSTAQISMAQLRLLVLNSGRTIPCPIDELILIGRGDAAGGIFPQVDLSQDNGYMAGVSRQHARIIRRGDSFFLEDLESMNGTFLNRKRLAPHTPTPFQGGDEIRLGNMVLRVILEDDSPAQVF